MNSVANGVAGCRDGLLVLVHDRLSIGHGLLRCGGRCLRLRQGLLYGGERLLIRAELLLRGDIGITRRNVGIIGGLIDGHAACNDGTIGEAARPRGCA